MDKLTTSRDRIISLYKSGKSTYEIANIFNCGATTVGNHLREWGIDLTGNRKPVDVGRIVELYTSGMSENSVANKMGVSRKLIRRRLNEQGINVRGQSEAESLKWSQMSDKERFKQVEAANKAIRNKPKSFHIKSAIKQAKTKEQTLSKVGDLERLFREKFEEKGFEVIPQKAVYVYNIDLAIRNTAVEIHINSQHPHNGPYYSKRIVKLLKRDWNVIYIKVGSNLSIQRATDKVSSMINFVESNKPAVCQYGMVRGSGKLETTGSLNSDELSTVPASDGFFTTIK